MKIPASLSKPAEVARAYTLQAQANGGAQREDKTRRFDSVTISGESGSFEMELRSRLHQEVRTATTSGMLSALKEQIQSGTYQPDAGEIARKMLLLGEAG